MPRINNQQLSDQCILDQSCLCSACTAKIFPFYTSSDEEFARLYISNVVFDMDRLPNIAFNSYITNDNEDPDNNLPLITSRYYKVNAFVELLQKNLSQKNLNSFSVMHSNIRSLSKNLHLLKDFLIMTESKFSIIGISETKLNDNSVINIDLPNYKIIKENSPTQAGGVGMYIHKTIDFKVRSDLNLNIEGCECLWIEILNMYDEKNPIVGVVYRHPHSGQIEHGGLFVAAC